MNLPCKTGLATTAIAATLAIACTLPGLSEPEPTRRPTYTPYPTFTPTPSETEQQAVTAPPKPIATVPWWKLTPPAPPRPSQTTQTDPTVAPTVDPNAFREVGGEEWFFGLAATEFETGSLMRQGDYQAALDAFKRAQVHHGKPSGVLEGV